MLNYYTVLSSTDDLFYYPPEFRLRIAYEKHEMEIGPDTFYTGLTTSALLVNEIAQESVSTLVDLGSGRGSLALAGRARWPTATAYCYDVIYGSALDSSARKDEGFIFRSLDVLSPDFDEQDIFAEKFADVIVSNPPFLQFTINDYIASVLAGSGLDGVIDHQSSAFPAHYGFLAQSLRLLSPRSELAIILPESFVSAQRFERTRTSLMEGYKVRKVVELAPGSFSGTEARCYAFFITNGITDATISLHRAGDPKSIEISRLEAAQRLDFKYYDANLRHDYFSSSSNGTITLNELGFDVVRGAISAGSTTSVSRVCHTSDIRPTRLGYPKVLSFDGDGHITAEHSRLTKAARGDLLVSRVGSRVVGDIAFVDRGETPITDCIFRVRPLTDRARKYVPLIFKPSVSQHLRRLARGTCARYITRRDLLDLTVPRLRYD